MPTEENIELNEPAPFSTNTWIEILRLVKKNKFFRELKNKYSHYHLNRDQINAVTHEQGELTLRLLMTTVILSYAWKHVVSNMAAHLEKEYIDPVSCYEKTIPLYNFQSIKYINPFDHISIAIAACVIGISMRVLTQSVSSIFNLPLIKWGLPVVDVGIISCLWLNFAPGLCFAINSLQCSNYQSRIVTLQGDYSHWYYELDGKNRYLHSPYLLLFPKCFTTIVIGLMIISGLFFGSSANRRNPDNRNESIDQPLIMIVDRLLNRLPYNLYKRFIHVFYCALYRNNISTDKLKQFKQDFKQAYVEAVQTLPIFPTSPLETIFPAPGLKFHTTISSDMMITCCDGVTYDKKNIEKYIQKCVETYDSSKTGKEENHVNNLFFKPSKNSLRIFSPVLKHICIAEKDNKSGSWFKEPFTNNNFILQHFLSDDSTTDDKKWKEDPITHESFINPFVTTAGHTYSSHSLFKWISQSRDKNGNFSDPLTNSTINTKELIPNLTMARLMSAYS